MNAYSHSNKRKGGVGLVATLVMGFVVRYNIHHFGYYRD